MSQYNSNLEEWWWETNV